MREERRLVSAWVLSVLAHAALVGSGALVVAGSFGQRWDRQDRGRSVAADVPIELPTSCGASMTGPRRGDYSTPPSRG